MKDVSVERVSKLEGFFDNCLGPEIVSPLHTLGIPMCNYTNTVYIIIFYLYTENIT